MSADKPTRADPLAEWLDSYRFRKPADILRAVQAAAELRRLDASEAALIAALHGLLMLDEDLASDGAANAISSARAAIARAKEARNG